MRGNDRPPGGEFSRKSSPGPDLRALAMITSAEPGTQIRILFQLRAAGLLDPLFSKLPWAETKKLYDSLPFQQSLQPGDRQLVKIALEKHFMGEDKYGTVLGEPAYHAQSVTGYLQSGSGVSGAAGELLAGAYNLITFNAAGKIGAAEDARSKGLITEEQYDERCTDAGWEAGTGMLVFLASAGVSKLAAGGGRSGPRLKLRTQMMRR